MTVEVVEVQTTTVTVSGSTETVLAASQVETVVVGIAGPQGAAGTGTALVVQDGDVTVVSNADTLDFAAADFDVTQSPTGEANIALVSSVFKTGGTDLAVADGGTGASDAATARTNLGVDYTTLDERARDTIGAALVAGSNVTITVNDGADTITIASTGGGGGSLTVQEGDVTVSSAASTLDFAAADFDVTESPAGEANIALTSSVFKTGGTDLAVVDGGTGASDAATARTNLGAGDASTNTASSVDSELAIFSGTAGKTLKRATTTGLLKATSGVLAAATIGTDYNRVRVSDTDTGATVANTTTKTSLLASTLALPSDLAVGDIIIAEMVGTYTNNSGGTSNLTHEIALAFAAGTVATMGSGAISMTNNANLRRWRLVVVWHVEALPATQFQNMGYVTADFRITNATTARLDAIDTTRSQFGDQFVTTVANNMLWTAGTLNYSITHSVANANTTMSCVEATLYRINKPV